MVYPYITQTKLQVRISFLKERFGKGHHSTSLEREYSEDGEWLRKEKALKDSLRRAKVAVVDYALNNDFEYFGTITINSDWHDVSTPEGQVVALDKLLKAFNNYRERMSAAFRYIFCPEYGEKKGRLHFHFLVKGLADGDLFKNEYKHLDWQYIRDRFGHVQITKIGKTDNDRRNVAFYCSKYITKDNIQLRSHRYFFSKDLTKPTRFCMDSYTYTWEFKKWLESEGFVAYYEDKKKGACCFSVASCVFFDMLKKFGIMHSRKTGAVLYSGFESFYVRDPFGACGVG